MPVAALTGLGPDELKDIFGFSPKIAAENVVLIGCATSMQRNGRIFAARELPRSTPCAISTSAA